MSRLFKKLRKYIVAILTRNKKKEIAVSSLKISDTIILDVMDKLAKFENNHGFLQPMTLHKLAKKLKTNPKYLSKIINNHYEKNFSSYINDLRIQYLLKELKTDDSLKKYTIKSLAKKLGFGNAESFAKAFKRQTNMNPSEYIHNLK
ncbi:helix-turn-helix domain-containing protein [Kordia periserrulae]|nr:helix-turn-helix domain-containing protein [Kordia periserrulae]